MYAQMEFDFTFNCFCNLIDNFNGNIIGGCREECFYDTATGHYYPTADAIEKHAMYDCTPVCNTINYTK